MARAASSSPVLFQVALGTLLIVCSAAAPRTARAAEAKRDVKRQIEQMEAQWRTAQLSGDIVTMDHMMSDDYVGITITGQVTTKVQQLARLRNHSLVLTRLDMQEMKIKLVGQVAIVTVRARVEGTSSVRPINGEYRYTRIYHQVPSGSWKITNFEATRLLPGHHHGFDFGWRSGQGS